MSSTWLQTQFRKAPKNKLAGTGYSKGCCQDSSSRDTSARQVDSWEGFRTIAGHDAHAVSKLLRRRSLAIQYAGSGTVLFAICQVWAS